MFWTPERQAPSAWVEHVPFAFWLVDVLRPATIVELGTYSGVSYSAMCQAVRSLGLPTRCFAIDTWKGDEHAGFYPEEVYRDFATFHDQHYSAFSRLVRSTFDEALRYFEDRSIDLLHIDGFHTYDAVRHDYESWLPKLSPDAVIIFHDTNVRENNFGVFRLWSEIASGRLHFTFLHGHGLGVLGLGHNYSNTLRLFFDANEDSFLVSSVREVFASRGQSARLLYERFALDQALAERDRELGGFRHALTERDANIAGLNQTLAEREAKVAALDQALVERDRELGEFRDALIARDANMAVLGETLAESEAKVVALEQALAERDRELGGLRNELTERNASNSGLESTISALRASISWRITAPVLFVKRVLGRFRYSAVGYPLMLCWRVLRTRSRAPLRDWRAARTIANSGFLDREWYLRMNPDVAASGIDSVRHYVAFGAWEGRDPSPSFSTRDYLSHNPDVAAAGLNPLLHFILYGASEGRVASSSSGPCTPLQLKSRHGGAGDQAIDSSAAVGLFHEALAGEKDVHVAESLYHLTSPRPNLREAFIAWYGNAAIDFPPVAAPEVSIIIPAHRGLADLETCLRSLSVHRTTEPPFEVIVLDDCPDEPVLWAIPSSGGLIKIANEKNLGFLLTCNRGAAAARGRILCFLNSDTVVSAGWLRSLVEALDDVPRAAAAGGMLLNIDGTIQDAGWRILGDGWGYPIGRGSDPRNGSYTYRRLVDCVGGACFVVPRTIWNELGGFDTAYAPAYYEEFDFAFRAKARGLQVIYEPRSRVLHLGSASYGVEQRDELSSINHARFCKRFADILRKRPSDTADEFTLRHASGEGPVLLVMDYRVPQPDQHAGDVTISKYLAMLATAGWRVVFGPVNGRAEGPAAEALERQGIELIRAPVTIEDWLTKYGKHVREVWLARPEVAEKLLAPLRAYTDAHITYYTHDLHHLRLQRQAELHADPKLQVEAAKVKALECEIFRGVDRVTTPSAAEADIVRHLSPETPVTVLPVYYYDAAEIRAYDTGHFTALSDVVFVGGFPHRPNVDAALFIANEIMPLVWRERPEVRLLLIGYAPPAEVQALAGPRVVVTGQVPKLEPFFDASRVFLAALRYGAGVKGKIVEAMRLGLPVVTTPVGAEGIGIEPGLNAIVAEDASELARGVLELLHDAERCAALSKAGAELVRHEFSRAAARHALNEVFRTPRCGVCGSDRLIYPPLEGNFREAFVCRSCFALGRTEALARVLLGFLARDGESSLAELARRRSDLCMYEVGFVGAIAETLRGQPGYTTSEYFDDVPVGTARHGGIRCEDVTGLTFPDESFDVVISQDVMEHVPDTSRAFAEIARVLKPGGSHIFTAPQDRGLSQSVIRAKLTTEGIEHILPPEHHGDPIRPKGALVFTDFGTDLGTMHEAAGMHLIEHELPVLGGKPLHMLRVFEAVKDTCRRKPCP